MRLGTVCVLVLSLLFVPAFAGCGGGGVAGTPKPGEKQVQPAQPGQVMPIPGKTPMKKR